MIRYIVMEDPSGEGLSYPEHGWRAEAPLPTYATRDDALDAAVSVVSWGVAILAVEVPDEPTPSRRSPMSDTLVADLRAARDLISDPARWTQRTEARNRYGQPVRPDSPDAVCWCAGGARVKIVPLRSRSEVRRALNHAAWSMGFGSPAVLNDTTDHSTVLAMFDLAIEKTGVAG